MTKEPTEGEITTVVTCQCWPKREDWHVLAEIIPGRLYPGDSPGQPRIVVKQHRATRELRVDIYDCAGALDVTFTNAGVADDARGRAKWFRDVRTASDTLQPLTVRFMCRGDSGNLRFKS